LPRDGAQWAFAKAQQPPACVEQGVKPCGWGQQKGRVREAPRLRCLRHKTGRKSRQEARREARGTLGNEGEARPCRFAGPTYKGNILK